MAGEVLHVLQQERGGTFGGDDARHVEEQGALRFVTEPGLPAKAAFFRDAGEAERLAREAGEHHVTVRDVVGVHLRDVAGHGLGEPIVGAIGARGELVPLAGEHGMSAGRSETATDAADSGEQVDGVEVGAGFVRGAVVQFLQCGNVDGLALNLARLPALHGGRGQAERFGQLASGHAFTQLGDKLVGVIDGVLWHCITHRDECIS